MRNENHTTSHGDEITKPPNEKLKMWFLKDSSEFPKSTFAFNYFNELKCPMSDCCTFLILCGQMTVRNTKFCTTFSPYETLLVIGLLFGPAAD